MSRELTRRAFLGDAALVGVASAMGLENVLAGEAAPRRPPPSERKVSFDEGWSFSKGDIPNAQSPQYAGGVWTPVDLPHDWSIAGPFSESEPCGSEGAYLPTGIGWYRKSFQLPQERCGAPHPAAIRRRVPMQRCVDQRPASGLAPLWLYNFFLRPDTASSFWQGAERRGRARG